MFKLNCKGRLLSIEKPLVMGILNITPDSFYKGSRLSGLDAILKKCEQMVSEGATIIDIGGQSSRQNSIQLNAADELERVIKPIEFIRKNYPQIFISIDTFYSMVAQEAVLAGADMVNDISAGQLDTDMMQTVGGLNVPYIMMHMRGTPKTMQEFTDYENVTEEVYLFLSKKRNEAIEAGIKDIIIDPGFGFSKTIQQNLTILHELSKFESLNLPILLGVSRKSTIYKTLGVTADEALNGTTVLNTIGLINGASILRVHDVKEAVETIKLVQAYLQK